MGLIERSDDFDVPAVL